MNEPTTPTRTPVITSHNNGRTIICTYNNDIKDPESWMLTYDQYGRHVSRIASDDPKNQESYVRQLSTDGRILSVIRAENPLNDHSSVNLYDDQDKHIGTIYGFKIIVLEFEFESKWDSYNIPRVARF